MSLKYVQTNTLFLAGSGTVIGATSVVLTGLTDIYGNALSMSDFGTKGYGTLEPDTNNEEAFTFTGITTNVNGTVTLTGVDTALAKSPYTETSALIRTHSGGTKVVITDNVAFWNTFVNKNNDSTILGKITLTSTQKMIYDADPTITDDKEVTTKKYVDATVAAGSPDASTTVKGITKLSVAPASPTAPIAVGDNDTRVPTAGEALALVGTSGTPGSGNKYVTDADTATAATASKVARRLAGGNITVVTESANNNTTNAASTAYVDAGVAASLAANTPSYIKAATTLTVSQVVSTATQTTVAQFTGLTGDTDDEYLIDFELTGSAGLGNSAILALTFNNDTTAAHYAYASILMNAGTNFSTSATNIVLMAASAGVAQNIDTCFGTVRVKASKTIAGTSRMVTMDVVGINSGINNLGSQKGSGVWVDTTNQITSIELRVTQATGSDKTITGKASIYKINR